MEDFIKAIQTFNKIHNGTPEFVEMSVDVYNKEFYEWNKTKTTTLQELIGVDTLAITSHGPRFRLFYEEAVEVIK